MEKLEGSNQYYCDICNKKVDAYKGIKIRKFPPILTLSLSRFEYDWQTDSRKKINDPLKFNVEIDFSIYSENPQLYPTDLEKKYDLFAVLIHRGDAYGGHYHTYIRDTLKEGDWEVLMANIIAEQNKRKASEKHDTLQNNQTTELTEQVTETAKPPVEQTDVIIEIETTNESQTNKNEEDDEEQEEECDGKQDLNAKKGSSIRKRKKKNQNKKKRLAGKNVSVPKENDKKEKDKEEKDNRPARIDDTIFDEKEFPYEFENKSLLKDWFDFNDSTVSAIPMHRIQHQYGGSSENAYILIYRQRKLACAENFGKSKLPNYQLKRVKIQNEIHESERKIYKEAERNIEILTLDASFIDV